MELELLFGCVLGEVRCEKNVGVEVILLVSVGVVGGVVGSGCGDGAWDVEADSDEELGAVARLGLEAWCGGGENCCCCCCCCCCWCCC